MGVRSKERNPVITARLVSAATATAALAANVPIYTRAAVTADHSITVLDITGTDADAAVAALTEHAEQPVIIVDRDVTNLSVAQNLGYLISPAVTVWTVPDLTREQIANAEDAHMAEHSAQVTASIAAGNLTPREAVRAARILGVRDLLQHDR
jgi:hypothetical protein